MKTGLITFLILLGTIPLIYAGECSFDIKNELIIVPVETTASSHTETVGDFSECLKVISNKASSEDVMKYIDPTLKYSSEYVIDYVEIEYEYIGSKGQFDYDGKLIINR